MKTLIPLAFIAALLCGCPETKLPNTPPKAPEPKISLVPVFDFGNSAQPYCPHADSLA